MKLALDVGGTYTKHALIEDNVVAEKGSFRTIYSSADAFCEEVEKRIIPEIDGICLSIGGFYKDGVYLGCGSLPYVKDNTLMESLKKFSLPITMENDCICAGLCESKIGSLQGVQNAVVVILGSAMGSSLLLDGKVYRGSHNHASMLFQLPEQMDVENGVTDWDCFSNTLAINNEYEQYYKTPMNFKILEEKMTCGDLIASGVINRYCQSVANKIVCATLMIDPEKVVIGGGVAHSRRIMEAVAGKVSRIYEDMNCHQDFTIEKCKFEDCNLLGAAML